ncbi:class I SAM-dependent methyltransferase [Amycolatopsis anabasis]|uniref:class I SAM-dependent methyltransferase n=1 Tax=Amycolatopsis anabasis TaxID=1840409 RepID=UPI00131B075F|nr:SAM-dependent methyltransferase [Amycolatopsis anabasis]
MIPGKPSRTAEVAAAVRAVEAVRPAPDRLLHDPYARHFITSPHWRALYRFPFVATRALDWYDKRFPGVISWVVLRAVFVDEIIAREAERGLEQIVFVGAGYDTSALRLRLPEPVGVFEVDHPSTQRLKKSTLERHGLGSDTRRITFVPCDLSRDDMASGLREAGFDPARKSLFIWLAVVMFLDEESATGTFRQISELLSDGGLLIHDYIARNTREYPGGEAATTWTAARGEPYYSMWNATEVEDLLGAQGLKVSEHLTMPELGRRYGSAKPAAKRAEEWISVVLAEKRGA